MRRSFITLEFKRESDNLLEDQLTLALGTAEDIASHFDDVTVVNVRCEWMPEQISPTDPTS